MSAERRPLYCAWSVTACCVLATSFAVYRLVNSDISEITGAETFVVYSVQKLLLGQPLYTDPSKPPFDITQYSPLYYYVCALAASFTGAAAEDAISITRTARLVSCFSWASTCAILFLIQRGLFGVGQLLASLVCGYLFVACNPWWFLARPDAMLSMFLTASFGCALTGFQRCERLKILSAGDRWFLVGGLFGVAAALTKQNGAQIVALFAAFCVVHRQWRPLFWGGAVASAVAAALIGLGVYWYGPALLANVVDGLRNGVSLDRAFKLTYRPVLASSAIVLATTAWICRDWSRAYRRPSEKFFAFSTVGVFLLATAAGLKYGSADNYYIDFLALALMGMSIYLTNELETAASAAVRPIYFLTAAYLFFFLPIKAFDNFRYLTVGGRYSKATAAAAYIAERLVQKPNAYFLSEDLRLTCLLPRRAVVPQPPLAKLADHFGIVNYDRLARLYAMGRITYLAKVADERTPIQEVVFEYAAGRPTRFRLLKRFGEIAVYQYAGDGATQIDPPLRAKSDSAKRD